ncbi:MAG: TatD related DNase [Methanomassiliicoccales archaeon PtaU1.Bin124]|nr:MAG: TatD related DNase [Methanomassiliicoccales archaeon PtaU1.Bin124]
MPYEELPIHEGADFARSYEITTRMTERCNAETDATIFCTVGPYPVLLLELAKEHGLAKAKDMMLEGMDAAGRFVAEGKAIAIGEVGRPHFPVEPEIMDASNDILVHGMRLCREIGCAIVIHAESATPEVMRDLARLADIAGLDRSKVVKHYCTPLVKEEENHGLVPSVLASRSQLKEALEKGDRFFLETDYMDDPERPDGVLPITTVPKRVKGLASSGEDHEEAMWRVNKDLPEKTYGVKIE